MSSVLVSPMLRPQVRSSLVFGPPLLSAGTTVYHIKDLLTDWFYRIGAKEYFLISRMDGSKTLQDIEAEYAVTFGRRLSAQSWKQIFSLLEQRYLLVGDDDLEQLAALKAARQKEQRTRRRIGFLKWRLPLLKPDAFLEHIHPWLTFAFHPAFVYPALAAIILLELFCLVHLKTILGETIPYLTLSRHLPIPLIGLAFLIIWIFLAVHEFAHGLACKHFGGSVPEIGVLWRYLSFFPYCKIDDVILFHNRWHRVYTASAGVFINLLMIVPFAVFWQLTPAQNMLHVLSSFVLLFTNASTLSNLIPFIELDGYLILNHLLNMVDLRKDAHRLWQEKIRWARVEKQHRPITYEGHSRHIYLLYGFFSLIFTIIFLSYTLVIWFLEFVGWFGQATAWYMTLALLLLILLSTRAVRTRLLKEFRRLSRRHQVSQ